MWLWGSRQISETCASRQKDCRAGPLKVSTCRESIGAWSYFTVWHKSEIIEVLRIKSIWDFQLFLCFSGIRPKSPPAQHTSCRLCPLAVTWSSRRKQPIRKILDQLWEKLIKISQAPSSPTVINCEIHTCALAICFHQSNSIRSPYPHCRSKWSMGVIIHLWKVLCSLLLPSRQVWSMQPDPLTSRRTWKHET